MNEEFVVNKSKSLGLSVDGTRRVLESAFKESTKLMPVLDTAVAQVNYEETQSVSHRLKGIFANLQFDHPSRIAQEINNAAIEKRDWAEIKKSLTELINAFETLKKESGV